MEASKKSAHVRPCCMLCRALLRFFFCSLYVHPDMHPQALCLSLFLLKLSSEVSEGLALLIPDIINENKSYTPVGLQTVELYSLLRSSLHLLSQNVQPVSAFLLRWTLGLKFFQLCSNSCIIQNSL